MRTLPLVLVGALLSASGIALAAETVVPDLPSCLAVPEPVSGLTSDIAACATPSPTPAAQTTSTPPPDQVAPSLLEGSPPVEFTPATPSPPLSPAIPTVSPTVPTLSPTPPITATPTLPTPTPPPGVLPSPTPTAPLPPGVLPTPTPTSPLPGSTLPGGLGGSGGGLLGGGGGGSGGSDAGGSGSGGGSGGGATSAAFFVSLEPASVTLAPGESVDVEIRLSSPASLVPLELTLAPEFDANALTAHLDPLVVVLPAGDVRSSTLRVTVPEDATPGAREVAIRVVRALTGEANRATLAVDVAPPPPAPNAPAASGATAASPATPATPEEAVQAEAAAEAPVPPSLLSPAAVATAAAVTGASGLGLAGYLFARRETWRFALAAFVAGLLARGRFDVKLRQRVLELVTKRPGITYGEIKRATGAGPVTLVAMLRTLERNRAIKASRRGSAWSFSLPASAAPLPKKRA